MNPSLAMPTPTTQPLEFEAPTSILALVHDTAQALDATPAQSLEAARTGRLSVGGVEVALLCAAQDDALVASTNLGADFLDAPGRAALALCASVDLMLHHDIAIGRCLDMPSLIGRWTVGAGGAQAFAEWLRVLASLALALSMRTDSPGIGAD